ncbi:hypothetical protein F66182_11584, partial [Fusarium sp. NRRL 66182]
MGTTSPPENGSNPSDKGTGQSEGELLVKTEANDSDAKEKRQKAKVKAKTTRLSKSIESLENERNRLLVKTIEGDKLSPEECQRLEQLKAQIDREKSTPGPQNPKEPKEPRPKTVREFWQRQLRREEEQQELKRKRDEEALDANKIRKTTAQTSAGGISQQFSSSKGADLFVSRG